MLPFAEGTVLFADVSGSTKLYETVGDARALEIIRQCIEILRATAEASRGRVVKTMGDAVMVLFDSASEAANAGAKMHVAVEAIVPPEGSRFGVRIGFNWGPLIHEKGDVFGDTVNLAFRVLEQARAGQILTSEETAARLVPAIRRTARRLHPVVAKGKAAPLVLWEIVWRQSPDVTDMATAHQAPARAQRLVLRHQGRAIEPPLNEALVIGRSADCQLVVTDHRASRQHCTIERRLDRFRLQDHSTNGTYVTIEGEPETVLHRESLLLRKRGWITFGQRNSETAEAIEFDFDQAP